MLPDQTEQTGGRELLIMDEYDGELMMLDDSFSEAIAGVEYDEEGNPLIKYDGPTLVQLHMAFGFGEKEAYEEKWGTDHRARYRSLCRAICLW